MSVVLPVARTGLTEAERVRLRDLPLTLATHAPQLEQLLGAPVQVMTFDPGRGPRWLVGPARLNPAIASPAAEPTMVLDREGELLVTDAPDVDGIFDALGLLAAASRLPDGAHAATPCDTVEEAVERVEVEVGDTWPSFQRRGLDWRALCERHRPRVLGAEDPVPALQGWLAELGDTHTWIHATPPWGRLPYTAWVQGGDAVLVSVPAGTAGWKAGARPGHRVVSGDAADWWRRTAAPGYARPLIAGARLLSGPVGALRVLEVRGPGGRRVAWEERVPRWPWDRPVTWRRLPSGAGLVEIRRFPAGDAVAVAVDEALEALSDAPVLVVDLRGNGGGNPYAAARFRSRFLRQPTRLGSIRYREPGGRLSVPFPVQGTPARPGRRWEGPVRFLTDALTHSSAEEALLGLQGLPHVTVIGEPSGGASHRVRELPLLPGWKLGVSTALTYDRNQRCLEGAGVPVDRVVRRRHPVPGDEDPVLAAAEST